MPHVKKLVLKGFKSFAKETEIPFTNAMNVIVGPNGSGKSNITDAICFVLGRLGIKSMRASKAANLIFAGNKTNKPASEASVKLVFDNTDKIFNINKPEVVIERIVRKNGQGIYRINNETKTRQEILELLAQSGIDPYGFNIVLQGEISSIIKVQSEERRKIIEEVAGISIYETRKERSLKELDKTDNKLKEIQAVLRERTAYLRNLEKERQQALRFKQLQETEKRCKASIIKKKIDEKLKEVVAINKEIEKNTKNKTTSIDEIKKIQQEILDLEKQIEDINKYIQKSTGTEQEKLHSNITDLRAELAGLEVRKDNSESRFEELERRKEKIQGEIKSYEDEIKKLKGQAPLSEKHGELEKKKQTLEELEKNKREFYKLNTDLKLIKERIKNTENAIEKTRNEIDFITNESEKISQNLEHLEIEKAEKQLEELEEKAKETKHTYEKQKELILKLEKSLSVSKSEIQNLEKIKEDVSGLETCPLCKTKITKDHIGKVSEEAEEKIQELSKKQDIDRETLKNATNLILDLEEKIKTLDNQTSKNKLGLINLRSLEDKKENIKKLAIEEEDLKKQLEEFNQTRKEIENKTIKFEDVEENYQKTLIDFQEISSRHEENINVELEFKERDFERTKLIIKQITHDEEDLENEITELTELIEEKTELLEKKEEQERILSKKFKKLFDDKNNLQKKLQERNSDLMGAEHKLKENDNIINNLKIEKARIDAEHENLITDLEPYKNLKLISASSLILQEKLEKTQQILQNIGNVNLRALEVYDEIKKEYDAIYDKTTKLEQEKLEILKIIEEIDNKKKRTFMKTLRAINELFSRNFLQLFTKGQAFLELENKEDPFSAGLNIIIRIAKGKYFDVTSLSGGEQTLVALSLIFAIQEYKPYCFYIFDEVDAALDKRNSERLATLVKKYMKTGQYIIVTHNDAVISESTVLYGVSMQEGISKILSLEI